MKVSSFKVPFYRHTISVVVMEGNETPEELYSTLKKLGVNDKKVLSEEVERAKNSINGACCLINSNVLKEVILVYKQTSKEELYTSLFHEMRHAVDHIIEVTNLEGDEACAYLEGYVGWRIIKNILDYEPNKTV